ncbi:pyridoxamine 5'-phosphate oxidase family protein [Robertkochia solimangrovi]|uniref:pyridoxamine 5'-phosphate oxidase family protein n=1 Tax=Robertkochia solimangrovi TaxID=2213046 RepID=UPI001180F855|nr:pyridoxamine 5'-phosphate oxidase family protein [Robertkochia solimangrovi]TRZ41193.1 pyridoxamine 5'-phosphate oxidase family protein [Robertkochia solimangrovi]
MGKKYDKITSRIERFIAEQKIFFVGTAMADGRVNVSPKGMDSFRVVSSNKVLWLNLTGSGNETATHIQFNDRMTVMFCAFDGPPMILRLYGHAKAWHEGDPEFERYVSEFPKIAGTRQIFEMNVDLVQTSCGMAVPFMDFKSERTELADWAEDKGVAGIHQYQKDKNLVSLDGKPTGMPVID